MDFKERWTPLYEVLLYSFSLRRGKWPDLLLFVGVATFKKRCSTNRRVIRGYLVTFCPRIASFK